MSEKLLKAILHLFAIVAKEDGVQQEEKASIKEFLEENLGQEDVVHYMDLLELYINETQEELEVLPHLEPGIDYDTVDFLDDWSKVMQNSAFINKELTKQQKLVLILKMIEIILSDGDMSERESNLVFYIGKAIKVDLRELKQIKKFVNETEIERFNSNEFLVIHNSENDIGEIKHALPIDNLVGNLVVLRIPSEEIYFIKYINDAAHEHHVYLNGILLKNGKTHVFSTGSTLRGHRLEPLYYSDIISKYLKSGDQPRITFEAIDVSYKFPNGYLGLREINLAEESGHLVGIMGGSGAGKSTLMNVLNGHEKLSSGEVLINGINIHTESEKIKGVIGHVPQDDLLMEDLTVFQNLFYAAELCFNNKSKAELTELVNSTLKSLGLLDIKDLKVGNPLQKTISGGQRKRVNIGLELLREPAVLFLDEPTSGLSSRDSENIMDLLKELTLKGKLIFVVIHQPSSDIFKMFDRLIILDVGGYQIYYGNPVETEIYFKDIINMIDRDSGACPECGNIRPEEVFNIIEMKVVNEYGRFTDQRKVTPEKWNEHFEYRTIMPEIKREHKAPEVSLNIPNWIKQLQVFIERDVLSKLSNTQYMVINLLEAPLLAFILAYIVRYYEKSAGGGEYVFSNNLNIPAFFFMSIIVALFMGLTVSAEEIIKDRKILKREHFLNLSRSGYLVSKLVILFTLSAIQTVMFVLIGDLILDIGSIGLSYWLVLFSVSCFANVLGLNISDAFNSVITVYILIPLLLIPQLILSGVVVQFDKLNPDITNNRHVPFVGELMASRWAYEAIMVTQFKHNPFEKEFYDIEKKLEQSEFKTVYKLPVLHSKLSFIKKNVSSDNQNIKEQLEYECDLVRTEIEKELLLIGKDKFPEINLLEVGNLDSTIFNKTESFLAQLDRFYNQRANKYASLKDKKIKEWEENNDVDFMELREKYQNEQIGFLVKNRAEATRILEDHGELIQKAFPIYNDPTPRHLLDFRTHFYAPVKHVLGIYIDTLAFNVLVIWIMTLILILTLYFDLLRNFLGLFQNLTPKKKR
jgi:ABC-type multidrug transport system ATPase subunit/uncharacterized tellurite resistance protein B-like protein